MTKPDTPADAAGNAAGNTRENSGTGSARSGPNEIDGERGIASIAGERPAAVSDKHKKIIVGVMLVFLGALAYLQWPREDQVPEDILETDPVARIQAARNFEPAEIAEVKPEPAPEPVVDIVPAKPSGPIERARENAGQDPATLSEVEQILESAKRAPLMAYAGTQSANGANAASPSSGNTAAGDTASANTGFGGTGDPAAQSGLSADLVTGSRTAVKASRLAHPHLTITEGTIIPCALESAMDSSSPGMVRCRVTDDVYSTTGAVILLDRGTRITGEYRGGMQRGHSRLFVTWTRAETPTGVLVNLSSPGADNLGRSGLTGDLDTQFWTRFGGTMMLSVIDTALVELANRNEDAETTSDNLSQLAETELETMIDIPVILRKNQGEEVSVLVARDLDFSGVYRLR